MTNPMNEWMDPQRWIGQASEAASNTVDMATKNMKMWHDQMKQTLDITTKTVHSTMENVQKVNEQMYHTWETGVNQIKEMYDTPKTSKK